VSISLLKLRLPFVVVAVLLAEDQEADQQDQDQDMYVIAMGGYCNSGRSLAGFWLPFGQLNEPVICTCSHEQANFYTVSVCVLVCVCAREVIQHKYEKTVEAAPIQGQPKDNAYLRVVPSNFDTFASCRCSL